MKRQITIFMFIGCLIVSACSRDEESKVEIIDEAKPELTGEYLKNTDWGAKLTSTQPSPNTAHFVIFFLTNESGQCTPSFGETVYDGPFTYHISNDKITFNGSLEGEWTCVELSKTKMTLQTFRPTESTLVLNKIIRE